MGYIYKITNDVNQKIYIGKTESSIEERWKEHCKDAKRSSLQEIRPLYRAIKKYGIEHFHIEEIGEYPNEQLNEMEIYWIAYYQGFGKGYNATKGGDGKSLYDYEAIKDFLLKTPYTYEAVQEFGCSVDVVYKVAKLYNITLLNPAVETIKIKLLCYDKKTNEFIASFASTIDAIRWVYKNGKCSGANLDGAAYHISVASRPNSPRKTAYGYIWKTVEDLDKS